VFAVGDVRSGSTKMDIRVALELVEAR